MVLRQILGDLGFGAPLLYALAVYYFFRYLDKRASAKAKRAVASWCEGNRYQGGDAAAALTEIFDRLYTAPFGLARLCTIGNIIGHCHHFACSDVRLVCVSCWTSAPRLS
jgi:hypothetical protein